VRRPRIAWAPKLMRRVNGVVGAVRALPVGKSSSSIAFSSIESELLELVDVLPLRKELIAELLVGEVPVARPSVVVMDSLRRWASLFVFMAADGKTGVP
jgi:hypothetical protein